MRPQTPLYQQLIGRTAVRPYTRNLGQPTFETASSVRPYATNLNQPHIPDLSSKTVIGVTVL